MLVQGMDELERKFGFVPDFHDDLIESILITPNRIELVIQTVDGPSRVQKCHGARVKLTFTDVRSFQFQGEMYGTVSIILDLWFEEKGENIETVLETSLGTEGRIVSKEVAVSVL